MGRPKGSKNKGAAPTDKGDPRFNINEVTPSSTIGKGDLAAAAITDEDLALDRELEMMSRNTEPDVSDVDPGVSIKKEVQDYTHLAEVIDDYKPAMTLQELEDQVTLAKHHECDSIYASPKVIRYYTKKDYPDKVGYFIFKDIKVYIEGFFEQSKKRDSQTMEQKIFGDSKTV